MREKLVELFANAIVNTIFFLDAILERAEKILDTRNAKGFGEQTTGNTRQSTDSDTSS